MWDLVVRGAVVLVIGVCGCGGWGGEWGVGGGGPVLGVGRGVGLGEVRELRRCRRRPRSGWLSGGVRGVVGGWRSVLKTWGRAFGSLDLAAMESLLFGAAGLDDVLVRIARVLRDIAACAGQVSDRLGLRYFAHVDDVSQRTVST